MKQISPVWMVPVLLALLTGCGQQGSAAASAPGGGESVQQPAFQSSTPSQTPGTAEEAPAVSGEQSEISPETALTTALNNAGVPETDAYHIQIETDGDNGIPIYDIEFETDYGDYDFEVDIETGSIVGADYEVDEEWLDQLGGSAVTLDQARAVVQEKVPGADPEDIQLWEEDRDGRGRYEGELFSGSMKYEFEIDSRTGIIFDWTADLRD